MLIFRDPLELGFRGWTRGPSRRWCGRSTRQQSWCRRDQEEVGVVRASARAATVVEMDTAVVEAKEMVVKAKTTHGGGLSGNRRTINQRSKCKTNGSEIGANLMKADQHQMLLLVEMQSGRRSHRRINKAPHKIQRS